MALLSVIIAAHGSSTHGGGAAVAERCRAQLEATGLVTGAIVSSFWRGDGLRLHEAIATCPPGYVLIIPLLMSDGYFAETVFPREFRTPVQGEFGATRSGDAVEHSGGHIGGHNAGANEHGVASDERYDGWDDQGTHRVRLGSAAGLDPRFDPLVLGEAVSVLRRADQPRLLLAGHGTERDPQSSRRLYDLAAQVREAAPEAVDRLQVCFLDEQPTVAEALNEAAAESLRPTAILPWFSADGMHVVGDLPDAVRDWGGSAEVLPSVGVSLFPQICESRVRAALETIRHNDEL